MCTYNSEADIKTWQQGWLSIRPEKNTTSVIFKRPLDLWKHTSSLKNGCKSTKWIWYFVYWYTDKHACARWRKWSITEASWLLRHSGQTVRNLLLTQLSWFWHIDITHYRPTAWTYSKMPPDKVPLIFKVALKTSLSFCCMKEALKNVPILM